MIYRRLDTNGDMTFGMSSGNFYKNQPEAVGQAVLTALKLFQGEWFIDTSAGVPYNTKILGFGNVPFYDLIIQETIFSVPGVKSISNYSSFIDANRNLTINATINTIYGIATIGAIL